MPDMETNDKMLKDFFSQNKQEIADNGFSNRVIRKLPETADRGWIVWVFAAIGMAISIYLLLNSAIIEQLLLVFSHISIYYILGTVFCFPLLGTAGYYLTQDRSYTVI
jgi:hypothetical protein